MARVPASCRSTCGSLTIAAKKWVDSQDVLINPSFCQIMHQSTFIVKKHKTFKLAQITKTIN